LPNGEVWISLETGSEAGPDAKKVSFPLVRVTPVDELYISPNGLFLSLAYEGIVKEIWEAGLQAKIQPLLEPLLRAAWLALIELANTPGLTEIRARAGIQRIGREANLQIRNALDWFYQKYLRLAYPLNPVSSTALAAIHSGGKEPTWKSDSDGKPFYKVRKKGYHVIITFESMPNEGDVNEALWDLVGELSVETGDVFFILLKKLMDLGDPKSQTACIRPEDLAKYRGVHHRHGSIKKLHEALKEQVLLIAKLRLTMVWKYTVTEKDPVTGKYTVKEKTLTFGKDSPEPLIDIVDWQYEVNGKTWVFFELRPGHALTHFLTRRRWAGYYSPALLKLNPREEAVTKKVGGFWLTRGEVSAKYGYIAKASIRTLLIGCGLSLKPKRPDKAVEALKRAHRKLLEMGVLDEVSDLEPDERRKGYFQRWLNKKMRVKLNPSLFEVKGTESLPGVCSIGKPVLPPTLVSVG
jgi:hypothetical protein